MEKAAAVGFVGLLGGLTVAAVNYTNDKSKNPLPNKEIYATYGATVVGLVGASFFLAGFGGDQAVTLNQQQTYIAYGGLGLFTSSIVYRVLRHRGMSVKNSLMVGGVITGLALFRAYQVKGFDIAKGNL